MAAGLSSSIAMTQRTAPAARRRMSAPSTTSSAAARISASSQQIQGSHSAPFSTSVCAPRSRAEASLVAVGKRGAAEPGDARVAHALDEFFGTERGGICDGSDAVVDPVRAVALDHDADAATALRPRLRASRSRRRCLRAARARRTRTGGQRARRACPCATASPTAHDRLGAVARALIERERPRARAAAVRRSACRTPAACARRARGRRGTWIARPSCGTRLAIAPRHGRGRAQFDAVDGTGRQAELAARALRRDAPCASAWVRRRSRRPGRRAGSARNRCSVLRRSMPPARGLVAPNAGSSGRGARSSSAASARTVASPPGGQRSMSAAPLAMAAA